MAIKFWNSNESKEVFVRFDRPSPDDGGPSLVWLCYSSGTPHPYGHIVNRRGERASAINPNAALSAGLELDDGRRITADSLAEICAEMARQIQGGDK